MTTDTKHAEQPPASSGSRLDVGRGIVELIPKISLVASGAGLVLMTLLIVSDLTARNILGFVIPVSVEYSSYLVPAVALLGAAYTLSKEGHVNADIGLHKVSDRARQWVFLIGYILGLGYLIILDIQTFDLAMTSIKNHYLSMYPMRTPIGYAQLVVPIGISLFAIQLVVEIVRKCRALYRSYRHER